MSTNRSRQKLPEDLLWESGHASELALAAMADGEEALLTPSLEAHVHSCADCTQRFGETALLSAGTSRAIQELGPLLRVTPVPFENRSMAPASGGRRKLPVPMLVAAFVLAAAGAMPTLVQLPGRFAEFCFALLHTVPTLSRSSAQLFRSGPFLREMGPVWIAVTCACAVILVMMSIAVTRLLPKPVSS